MDLVAVINNVACLHEVQAGTAAKLFRLKQHTYYEQALSDTGYHNPIAEINTNPLQKSYTVWYCALHLSM